MFKFNNKTQDRHRWYRCDAFIINFEYISRLDLLFLLLIFNM